MIRYTCSACGKEHMIGNEFGGRQAKCPACGNPLRIPEKPPEAISDKALDALAGKVAAMTPASGPVLGDSDFLWLAMIWKILSVITVVIALIGAIFIATEYFIKGLSFFLTGLATGLLFYTFGVGIDLLVKIERNTRK